MRGRRLWPSRRLLLLTLAGLALTFGVACSSQPPEPTPTIAVLVTPPSPTPTPTLTPTPEPTPTPTVTPRPTLAPATPTATATPTITPTPTPSPTPTPTPTPTPIPILTAAQVLSKFSPALALVEAGGLRRTGFVFDSSGLILTTASAVTGLESAEVSIPGTGAFTGTVVGRDEFFDIAVLRISPGRSIPSLSFADPRGIVAGIPSVAVGYQSEGILGNAPTVLAGTVTGLRTLAGVTYLQTDTSLNQGNGGGPLSNNVGDVIGVNTTRVSEVFGGQPAQGIGLSVHVSSVLERLGVMKAGAQLYRPTTESDILPEGPTEGLAPFPNLFKLDRILINGEAAPLGTTVFARVGRYVTQWVTIREGSPQYVAVGPPIAEGFVGQTVTFYVDGFKADEQAVFTPSQDDPIRIVTLTVTKPIAPSAGG